MQFLQKQHNSKLRGIRTINKEGLWCEVESGVNLNQLDAQLAPDDLSVIVFDRTPPHLIIWEAHAQHVVKK